MAAQRATLRETAHLPWPLPDGRPLMSQTWRDLLFAHWRVDPDRLRAVVPPEIPLDVHDGSCWVGVTPFVVTGLRLAGTPPLPHLSRFPEINVRTYTTIGGRPGIGLLSLGAGPRERRARRAARPPPARLPRRHRRGPPAGRRRRLPRGPRSRRTRWAPRTASTWPASRCCTWPRARTC